MFPDTEQCILIEKVKITAVQKQDEKLPMDIPQSKLLLIFYP